MNEIVTHTGVLVGLRTGTTTTEGPTGTRVGVLLELCSEDSASVRRPWELLVTPAQAAALVEAERTESGVLVRFAGERLGERGGVPLVRVGRIAVLVPEPTC
ncbi:hypothetical protein DEJ16_09900 [Curtobacterium sp. MCJR17_055]|uniref:hypothetical protein n=1 Tax=unclassified Curtobacterium TaxID=257496 RepID=UPI000D9741BC|nr:MULTISPECIES: hypothetical protein [unclassified Curtobacterium]PYY32191.1 hypothetical protein DEI87_15155 [Curtobacterium sp. MCBD17_029]PYY54653.1 hypothetical protein DEJ16_09900 [Curtobacterium sp. MCJR17_055]PYY60888.1 hypothetical protein DEJ26_03050 [Curtobacterium sp. MCPF17_015]WIB35507.1 hypothetical protein DEJ15_14975 [Curtobacterium sp. MCJR17_043]